MLRQKHASLPEDNVQALLYLVTHDQSLQTGLGFREQQEWTWWLRWGKNQLVALGFRYTRHKVFSFSNSPNSLQWKPRSEREKEAESYKHGGKGGKGRHGSLKVEKSSQLEVENMKKTMFM